MALEAVESDEMTCPIIRHETVTEGRRLKDSGSALGMRGGLKVID